MPACKCTDTVVFAVTLRIEDADGVEIGMTELDVGSRIDVAELRGGARQCGHGTDVDARTRLPAIGGALHHADRTDFTRIHGIELVLERGTRSQVGGLSRHAQHRAHAFEVAVSLGARAEFTHLNAAVLTEHGVGINKATLVLNLLGRGLAADLTGKRAALGLVEELERLAALLVGLDRTFGHRERDVLEPRGRQLGLARHRHNGLRDVNVIGHAHVHRIKTRNVCNSALPFVKNKRCAGNRDARACRGGTIGPRVDGHELNAVERALGNVGALFNDKRVAFGNEGLSAREILGHFDSHGGNITRNSRAALEHDPVVLERRGAGLNLGSIRTGNGSRRILKHLA